ncbi:MAG: class I SAM-dependent methyltransferase [Chloroflexi bacterium]|nr:class I SAM-dependent methyltransferase [Chloroflexota bacterium]
MDNHSRASAPEVQTSLPETACSLCGSTEHDEFARLEWKGIPLLYYMCRRCGLVFQSAEDAKYREEGFYAEEYRKLYQGSEQPAAKDLAVQSGRAAALAEFLRGCSVTQVHHALDVGCSAGIWLEKLQQEFGCRPEGVEPGTAYRVYAQNRGLKVFSRLEEALADEGDLYDLISLAHVLEHLPDPVRTLGDLRRRLTPQGRLLVEVPNLYAHDSFEPGHLTCFSRQILVETVRRAGYEVVHLHVHGRPRSRLLPLYVTLLASPRQNAAPVPSLRPEAGVRLKRRAGMLYRRAAERFLPGLAWMNLPQS